MFDLTADGIAKLCGPAKAGEYLGRIEAVGLSRAHGGAVVWHIHWKLAGVAAAFVEDLVMFSINRPLAPAWHRIASVLASNDRVLLYKHEGAIRNALIGCTAQLTFVPGASGFVITGTADPPGQKKVNGRLVDGVPF